MYVINFNKKQVRRHTEQIKRVLQKDFELREIPAHIDLAQPIDVQVVALVDLCGLTPTEWQTQPIVVILPDDSAVAAAILAELHGRMGYFPSILLVGYAPDGGQNEEHTFTIYGVLGLQTIRDEARARRYVSA